MNVVTDIDLDPIDEYVELAQNHVLIFDKFTAVRLLKRLADEDYVALDLETTALSPHHGEVRLTQLYNGGEVYIIDHFFAGKFKDLIKYFPNINYVVYNAKFEQTWFDYHAPNKFTMLDVDFMAKCKLGGHPSSLARMCKRDLKIDLEKTLQNSDWSTPSLTDDQYLYAAFDAVVTWALFEYWWDELADETGDIPKERWQGIDVFNDAVRGTVECEQTGLQLNTALHMENIKLWKKRQEICLRTLRRFTPKSLIPNLNSNDQVSNFIKSQLDKESLLSWPKTATKTLKNGTIKENLSLEQKVLRPIQHKAPYPFSRWLIAFIQYRYYSKYLSTYGDKLITKQNLSGAVTSRFNIAQAATGRYSSSSDNLQNIPRKPVVRRAFYAPPDSGLTMVLADYSGIEVRVLAELSQDQRLLQDSIYGDVHSGSASVIYNIDEEEFVEVVGDKKHPKAGAYKEMRSKAKGFTFQLTYGAGAEALAHVLKCSVSEAEDAIVAWARRYPKAYNYRNIIFDQMNQTGFIPVCDGRTIYVRKPDRTMPVASNYGIQGAAASVMYRAVYHVHKNICDFRKGDLSRARLAATVHDELLLYAGEKDAERAHKALVNGMKAGWLDIFPGTSTDNLIEAVIGDKWSDKP